jgi:hypothetical protein
VSVKQALIFSLLHQFLKPPRLASHALKAITLLAYGAYLIRLPTSFYTPTLWFLVLWVPNLAFVGVYEMALRVLKRGDVSTGGLQEAGGGGGSEQGEATLPPNVESGRWGRSGAGVLEQILGG